MSILNTLAVSLVLLVGVMLVVMIFGSAALAPV
jgi:hypothetical protein